MPFVLKVALTNKFDVFLILLKKLAQPVIPPGMFYTLYNWGTESNVTFLH